MMPNLAGRACAMDVVGTVGIARSALYQRARND